MILGVVQYDKVQGHGGAATPADPHDPQLLRKWVKKVNELTLR